jgi:hypothetical protein
MHITSHRFWVYVKWSANVCFTLATISLLSPITAANALFPWVAFLLGNVIWTIDSYSHKNWPWFAMAGFFGIWDVLLIITRLCGVEIFSILNPLIQVLEKLP